MRFATSKNTFLVDSYLSIWKPDKTFSYSHVGPTFVSVSPSTFYVEHASQFLQTRTIEPATQPHKTPGGARQVCYPLALDAAVLVLAQVFLLAGIVTCDE